MTRSAPTAPYLVLNFTCNKADCRSSYAHLIYWLVLRIFTRFFIVTFLEQNRVVNRPLAGTVRRGKTPEEDEVLEEQLLKDPKQCAEHTMLVDLGRNDVGKVLLLIVNVIFYFLKLIVNWHGIPWILARNFITLLKVSLPNHAHMLF